MFADKVDYVFETESVSSIGDAADDPAIWFNQANPTKSLIFGTDKRKGIHVYDIYGKELSFSELGATNNIDLRLLIRMFIWSFQIDLQARLDTGYSQNLDYLSISRKSN